MKDLRPENLLALVTENRDADAALSLIRYFHERMDNGEGFWRKRLEDADRELLEEYCFQAFTQILDKKSADVAFGLKKPRGRQKQDAFERDVLVACHVEMLHRKGYTVDAAREKTAESFPVSEGAVKIAYTKYLSFVRQFRDHEIYQILSSQNKP